LKKNAVIFFLLTAFIIFIVFGSSVFSGKSLLDDPALIDVTFTFMPITYWAGHSYLAGEFPLWNPHILFGMPLLAQSHCGGMYPVSVALHGLLPYYLAGSLNILFHSVLAGILIYLVMRQRDISPLYCAAGSIIYILSGSYFASIYVPYLMGSLCGFLAFMLCLQSFVKRPRFITFTGGGLALAWCCLSGDVELLTYGLMTLYILVFFQQQPDGLLYRRRRIRQGT